MERPVIELKTHSHLCPLCAIEKARPFARTTSFGYPVQYYICENCGFVFQDPAESQAGDPNFYRETYRKIYQSTEEPTAKDLRQQTLRAQNQLDYLREQGITPPKRILDIGASSGLLLQTLREAFNSDAVGVEPGKVYREIAAARNLQMFSSLEELANSNPERFDLVTMMHVLEHMETPLESLKFISQRLLKRNGYLLVEVPNLYAHDSFELAHLSCFTAHTLTQMLLMAGFSLVNLRQHGYPRSETLDLYLTALAIPSNCMSRPERVAPEKRVAFKRKVGMFKRKALTRLNPSKTWLPLED